MPAPRVKVSSPVRTRRLIVNSLAALLALLAGVALSGYFYLRTSLPQMSGSLLTPGLTQVVEIVRDANAIPHIFAKNTFDAYFALGYVHAQDRLWQLEMNRRVAAGRLAEVFGPAVVDQDKFMRVLGLRRTAEAIYRNLDGDTQQRLTAYVGGINAFLEARRGSLPPEFLVARFSPTPFWAVDCVAWQLMMAWDLGGNWRDELLRLRLGRRLSPRQISQFLPLYPGEPQLVLPNLGALYAGLSVDLERLAAAAPQSPADAAASNNWAVSGRRTTSGKPMLANDPHLGLTTPSIWYFAHLSAPGLNVIGATLPGIPAVILGHNDRIAWGMTNTAPDVQDLYVEKLDPAKPGNYLVPGGSEPLRVVEERIAVRGEADVVLPVRITRHGPVISDVVKSATEALPEKQVMALAWTALRADDKTVASGHAITSAQNWREFVAALRDFHAPQNNFVYADVDGNIGFIAPGRVPVRRADNDLKGLAPAPGWDARYDWAGFVPFDQLPRSLNPPDGKLVTANQKIVGDDYPYTLSLEWGALPYRARRIAEMLDATAQHNRASFTALQADVFSGAAQDLLVQLSLDNLNPQSDDAHHALTALKRWDGKMSANASEPLLFQAWLRELNRAIYADELLELFSVAWDQRVRFLLQVLTDDGGAAKWCDDLSTTDVVEDCQLQAERALVAAMSDLRQRYDADPLTLRWGDAHIAASDHRPFGNQPHLGKLLNLQVASPGDTWTVNVGRNRVADPQQPFVNRHAASMRAIYDLADPNRSVFIHTTGQSGNRLSPFYDNFVNKWARIEYVPMSMRRADIDSGSIGSLTLLPK